LCFNGSKHQTKTNKTLVRSLMIYTKLNKSDFQIVTQVGSIRALRALWHWPNYLVTINWLGANLIFNV